ncbi:BTAD domain-containing putative transcriptional regulator [Microtetraspora sp. NBRC 13810]|uniref:AfsR/SARP family transcriptional regulator n=1 Tax=Microtetraspora sp. NBRC 13810 TaxID=3030990 RepID=UPI002554DFCD|nr:BTAD domain-containing putative transcriptional regulator [Microtetraspora sp. NBRC 13810]
MADALGYRLMVEPGQVDAYRFVSLAAQGGSALAAQEAGAAATVLRQALALWRGPAFADLAAVEVAMVEIARLEGLRLTATEDLMEADLRLGRHAEVSAELPALIAAHPLRERLRGQHMRALYGAGRQVEALAAYEEARSAFADRLGADPSPTLADLHLSMLRGQWTEPPASPFGTAPTILVPREPATPVAAASAELTTPLPTASAEPGALPHTASADPAAPVAPVGASADSVAAQPGTSPAPQVAPLAAAPLVDTVVPGGDIAVAGASAGPGRRGNLRARLTSFVGRERDVERVRAHLRDYRLVTLLGPGGAGKTRLGVESAEAVADTMPDGVWLVELATARQPAEVTLAIMAALDVRDKIATPRVVQPTEPREADDHLAEALSGRRLLIVLDNCEHVIEAAARLIDRLLAECPGIRILATSREPLGITGEITLTLPPLGLPPSGADPAEAAAYPAVRLFADRAAAVRPGYRVEDEAEAVTRICRELDGMPLAIELAAARLRALSTGQIADRLDDRFRLLTAGSRTALPRHQTLRAVVEWSWDLLDAQELVLVRRLAVFAEGATLDAAERVCAGPGLDSADVLQVLARLVDKSLVVFDTGRYRMLDTIRVYAAGQLAEAGEQELLREAHARYFAELAEEADPWLRRAEQLDWLARLAEEQGNLSAALRRTIDSGLAEPALRLVGALGWYWWLRGNRLDGALRAREALEIGVHAAPELRAQATAVYAINAMASALSWHGTRAMLLAMHEEAVRLRETVPHPLTALAVPSLVLFGDDRPQDERFLADLLVHPDPWAVASGLMFRGLLHLNNGRVEQGRDDLESAVARYRELGDRWGIGTALSSLSDLHYLRGEVRRSVALMREALAAMDELGAVEDTPYMCARLALGLQALGEREAAESTLTEAAEMVIQAGDRVGQAGVLGVLGDFARQAGDLGRARANYMEALRLAQTVVGTPPHLVSSLKCALGLLAEQEGDLAEARRLHSLALEEVLDTWDAQLIGLVVVGAASFALATGEPGAAARLLGGVEVIMGVSAVVEYDHVRVHTAVRAELGDDAFAVHLAVGRALTRDDVVALVRTHLNSQPAPAPDRHP